MSWSPAIEILSAGGVAGGGTGNVQIWEDGTVLFDGAGCPNGRGRRGKMSPARVRAVIDKLEEAQFFTWSCDDAVPCDDSFITSLTVQRGRTINTVVDTGCDSRKPLAAQAIELVMQAVGNHGCSPSSTTADSRPPGADAERARIIREAEDFVSAQGYTDAPPSVSGDAVVWEWIEGSLEARRGMLEPRAVRAYGSGGEWTVLFRYQDAQDPSRGRALMLGAGQTPLFVHQDIDLERL